MSRSMIAHYGGVLKGAQMTSLERVDYSAPISANVTFNAPSGGGTTDFLPGGRIVHLNSSGEFETGMTSTAGLVEMPLLLLTNSDEPDVTNPGPSPTTAQDPWVAAGPTGATTAIPVTAGYEFQSSEYATATYAYNDELTATKANTTAATGGQLLQGVLGTNPICGIVSRPAQAVYAPNAQTVLSFWGWYSPIPAVVT